MLILRIHPSVAIDVGMLPEKLKAENLDVPNAVWSTIEI